MEDLQGPAALPAREGDAVTGEGEEEAVAPPFAVPPGLRSQGGRPPFRSSQG